MYHYLKWAAISLFFKRNLRYIVLIAASLIGIYGADAVYRDFVDYFVNTGHKEYLFGLLLLKWAVVLALIGLLLLSIMRLGFGRETKGSASKKLTVKEKRQKDKKALPASSEEEEIMRRLEKFRHKRRLRRKSDLLMERMKKRR